MSQTEFTLVGKIKDAHSIRGELFLISFFDHFDWAEGLESVFLHKDSANPDPTRFREVKVSDLRPHKKSGKLGLIARFAGVDSRNDAEELKSFFLYVPGTDEDFADEDYSGFSVEDKGRGPVGEVEAIGGSAHQETLVVRFKDELYEIPFVEPLVLEIDEDGQLIKVDLPFGLLPGEDV